MYCDTDEGPDELLGWDRADTSLEDGLAKTIEWYRTEAARRTHRSRFEPPMSRADSPLRDRMIFLVGAQRSGTNWLQRMLSTHPDVASLPAETQLFSYGISRLAEIVHHGVSSSPATTGLYMDPDAFRDAVRDFCDAAYGGLAATVRPGASYILERSPQHALHLGLVADIYPDAQAVHIIRDGRDVARSQLAQSYGPDDVATAAREWRQTIESARAAAHRGCATTSRCATSTCLPTRSRCSADCSPISASRSTTASSLPGSRRPACG